MESNWRQNVFFQGMSKSDWLLCATGYRPPSRIPPTALLVDVGTPGLAQVWSPATAGNLPVFLGNVVAVGNFPYGFAVDPD